MTVGSYALGGRPGADINCSSKHSSVSVNRAKYTTDSRALIEAHRRSRQYYDNVAVSVSPLPARAALTGGIVPYLVILAAISILFFRSFFCRCANSSAHVILPDIHSIDGSGYQSQGHLRQGRRAGVPLVSEPRGRFRVPSLIPFHFHQPESISIIPCGGSPMIDLHRGGATHILPLFASR